MNNINKEFSIALPVIKVSKEAYMDFLNNDAKVAPSHPLRTLSSDDVWTAFVNVLARYHRQPELYKLVEFNMNAGCVAVVSERAFLDTLEAVETELAEMTVDNTTTGALEYPEFAQLLKDRKAEAEMAELRRKAEEYDRLMASKGASKPRVLSGSSSSKGGSPTKGRPEGLTDEQWAKLEQKRAKARAYSKASYDRNGGKKKKVTEVPKVPKVPEVPEVPSESDSESSSQE